LAVPGTKPKGPTPRLWPRFCKKGCCRESDWIANDLNPVNLMCEKAGEEQATLQTTIRTSRPTDCQSHLLLCFSPYFGPGPSWRPRDGTQEPCQAVKPISTVSPLWGQRTKRQPRRTVVLSPAEWRAAAQSRVSGCTHLERGTKGKPATKMQTHPRECDCCCCAVRRAPPCVKPLMRKKLSSWSNAAQTTACGPSTPISKQSPHKPSKITSSPFRPGLVGEL